VSDLEVIQYRPDPQEYAWTFGGAAPVRRIRTPAVLEVFTEDCFAGRVRSEAGELRWIWQFDRAARTCRTRSGEYGYPGDAGGYDLRTCAS
jgi:hypothetical protein